MNLKIKKAESLAGTIKMPGDKSISHRSLILSSIASGKSKISGFLESDDCLKTLSAFRNLGVKIDKINPGIYVTTGTGLKGLQEPDNILNCGNSGTCMRIMTGLLSAQNFYTVLTGDSSLRERPMDRIIDPLTEMGAKIWFRKNKLAPLSIQGSQLKPFQYNLPVASAQVKSCLLLAGLYVPGQTELTEPGLSRDHTERMLKAMGAPLVKKGKTTILSGNNLDKLTAVDIEVPGDISSASYFIAAGLITNNSKIIIKNTGINYTRSGILEILGNMEADLKIENKKTVSGEPMGDIIVESCDLKAANIKGEVIPRLIDEIPILAILATQAEGTTIIKDASELRVKETDRIQAVVNELKKLGVKIKELEDGMVIEGPQKLKGGVSLKSYGDHRIAMSLAIAGLICEEKIEIKNTDCIETSFPDFKNILESLF